MLSELDARLEEDRLKTRSFVLDLDVQPTISNLNWDVRCESVWSEAVRSEVVWSVGVCLGNNLAWIGMSSLNLDVWAGAVAHQSDLRCPL